MRYKPPQRIATLAMRLRDLNNLRLPEAHGRFVGGNLIFDCTIEVPGGGRRYQCQLTVFRNGRSPQMRVIGPDLRELADGRRLPHIYRNDGPGVLLCLWLPNASEWTSAMKLSETYIPWTVRWLAYFELWLASNIWSGGGVHGDDVEDWQVADESAK